MMHPEPPPPPAAPAIKVTEVSRPRVNGWSCPLHPLQFVGWFFVIFFAIAHYGFLMFYTPGHWRIIVIIVPGLVLIAHVLCTVMTTSLNPADPGVRNMGAHSRPKFNPSTDGHVIQNRFCRLCDANVNDSAKHCRTCDKCVNGFDHHCIWLNTCIGERNYRWFFMTVLTALLGAVLLFMYSSSLFIVYLVDRCQLCFNCNLPYNLTLSENGTLVCDFQFAVFGASMPHQVFPALCAVLVALSALAIGLDGHLFSFHVYLNCKGISTYEYILLQRNKDPKPSLCQRMLTRWRKTRKKRTRVAPSNLPDDTDQARAMEEGRLSSLPSADLLSQSSLSNMSNESVGLNNFGRTPTTSVSPSASIDSALQQDLAATLAPTAISLPAAPTDVELALVPPPTPSPTSPRPTSEEHDGLCLPDPPSFTQHSLSHTMARSVSTGDMNTSSTPPVVKNHEMSSCSQAIPLPDTRAENTKKKSHSVLISLDSPQSLSLSQPLPPIGSSSLLSSGNIVTARTLPHKLKGPKMLPALHTSSRPPRISSQPNIAGQWGAQNSTQNSDVGTFL